MLPVPFTNYPPKKEHRSSTIIQINSVVEEDSVYFREENFCPSESIQKTRIFVDLPTLTFLCPCHRGDTLFTRVAHGSSFLVGEDYSRVFFS